MMPSGHKVFLVQNPKDVELLLMHNRTYAAEYVSYLLVFFFSPRHDAINISLVPLDSQITLISS